MNQQTENSDSQAVEDVDTGDTDEISLKTPKNGEQSEVEPAGGRDDSTEPEAESPEAGNEEEHDGDVDLENSTREEVLQMLIDANSQIDEMKEGYIRAQAEMENVRRRSQNEIVSARKYAIEGFAQELLSVVDSLDQASRVELEKSSESAVLKMKEGLELTLKQFESVMGKFGVTLVEAAKGVKFNPEIHQAISMVESEDVEAEHILDVMQKGYQLKDRLLRPAMVTIAR